MRNEGSSSPVVVVVVLFVTLFSSKSSCCCYVEVQRTVPRDNGNGGGGVDNDMYMPYPVSEGKGGESKARGVQRGR